MENNGENITKTNNNIISDADKKTTTCPDCGCDITFENDGLNGFCKNCAKNH